MTVPKAEKPAMAPNSEIASGSEDTCFNAFLNVCFISLIKNSLNAWSSSSFVLPVVRIVGSGALFASSSLLFAVATTSHNLFPLVLFLLLLLLLLSVLLILLLIELVAPIVISLLLLLLLASLKNTSKRSFRWWC